MLPVLLSHFFKVPLLLLERCLWIAVALNNFVTKDGRVLLGKFLNHLLKLAHDDRCLLDVLLDEEVHLGREVPFHNVQVLEIENECLNVV